MNLSNAKELGIDKLLITCHSDNTASEKTILANGGIYEKTIAMEEIEIKRYWIDITR
jgi:predicted acetyltransferase